MTKVFCPNCGILKTDEEFYKNKSKKSGLSSWCKSCSLIYNKSDKAKEYQKKYRASEEGKKYRNEYQHSEKMKLWHKEYQKTDKRITYEKSRRKTESRINYNKEYMKEYSKKNLLSDRYIKIRIRSQYGITDPHICLVNLKKAIIFAKREMKQYGSMA